MHPIMHFISICIHDQMFICDNNHFDSNSKGLLLHTSPFSHWLSAPRDDNLNGDVDGLVMVRGGVVDPTIRKGEESLVGG